MNLKDKLVDLIYNPSAIQELVLDELESNKEGNYVPDPGNPFTFLLESAIVTASSAMSHASTVARDLYPKLATEQKSLYKHMSDKDYLDRFAVPTQLTVNILLPIAELRQKAVQVAGTSIKQLIMPANTRFEVQNYRFGIEYPILFRVLENGGITAVWEGEHKSPIYSLNTNRIDQDVVMLDGIEFLRLSFVTYQFSITSHYAPLNSSEGFKETYSFKHRFYYARAYYRTNATSPWVEIVTTHSEQVYDPTVPTLTLEVLSGQLRASVPQIYFNTNAITGELRLDIYTTQGALEQSMAQYPPSEWVGSWNDYNERSPTEYVAPINTLTNIIIYSDDTTRYGRNELSFAELKNRVIYSGNTKDNPSSAIDLEATAANLGFKLVKAIDNVTDRVFYATKPLSLPTAGSISASAAVSIEKVVLKRSDLLNRNTIKANGKRITITPDTLYKTENGIVSLVSDDERSALDLMLPDQQVTEVNKNDYSYSPFDYVLESDDTRYNLRPYYLSAPKIDRRNFIRANDELAVRASISGIEVERTTSGYLIKIVLSSNKPFKALADDQCHVQLSFIAKAENKRVFLNGQFMGRANEERIYHFALDSTYDINADHEINFTNFESIVGRNITYMAELETTFDLIIAVSGYNGNSAPSPIDPLLYQKSLPKKAVGLTHEQATIQLGVALEYLRSEARAVVSSKTYKRYTADVPALYTTDVYEYDKEGYIKLTKDKSGEIKYVVLHRKGDPVLDKKGKPIYHHRRGDPKLDKSGKPVIDTDRVMEYHASIYLIEGVYRYVTTPVLKTYRDSIPKEVVDNTLLMREYNQSMPPRTMIYHSPNQSRGVVNITVKNNERLTIPAALDFAIDVYMTAIGYSDNSLKATITSNAQQLIAKMLNGVTISTTALANDLAVLSGDNVVSVKVYPLGPAKNLDTFTILDNGATCSVGRSLELLADNTIQVVDNIKTNFINHK